MTVHLVAIDRTATKPGGRMVKGLTPSASLFAVACRIKNDRVDVNLRPVLILQNESGGSLVRGRLKGFSA
jgi:hypothetical protein